MKTAQDGERYKDPEWLLRQYKTLGKSQSEIAEMCSVSQCTVSTWVVKFENPPDGEFECPSCPLAFDTQQGMYAHHASAHGESLRYVSVECDRCGKEAQKQPSDYRKTDGTYCSHDCYAKDSEVNHTKITECEKCGESFKTSTKNGQVKKYCSNECRGWTTSGDNSFEEKTLPTFTDLANIEKCDVCGNEFDRKPSAVRENVYCSRECMGEARTQKYKGETNPNYKGKVEKECPICEEIYFVKSSIAETSVYCSIDCRNEGFRTGSFFYNGEPHSLDPQWQEKRERALERYGYECGVCSMSDEKHQEKHDSSMPVHHIIPRVKFVKDGEYDYEKANKQRNLIPLCRSHHRIWEGIPVVPE